MWRQPRSNSGLLYVGFFEAALIFIWIPKPAKHNTQFWELVAHNDNNLPHNNSFTKSADTPWNLSQANIRKQTFPFSSEFAHFHLVFFSFLKLKISQKGRLMNLSLHYLLNYRFCWEKICQVKYIYYFFYEYYCWCWINLLLTVIPILNFNKLLVVYIMSTYQP